MEIKDNWRPDDWHGIRDMSVGREEDGFIGKVSVNAFEIGADAMLQALKWRIIEQGPLGYSFCKDMK